MLLLEDPCLEFVARDWGGGRLIGNGAGEKEGERTGGRGVVRGGDDCVFDFGELEVGLRIVSRENEGKSIVSSILATLGM